MSLVALGICLTSLAGGKTVLGIGWAVITVGWFAISMWLWRQHVRFTS